MLIPGVCALFSVVISIDLNDPKLPDSLIAEFAHVSKVERELASAINAFNDLAVSSRHLPQGLLPTEELRRRINILTNVSATIDTLAQNSARPDINVFLISLILTNSVRSLEPVQVGLSKKSTGCIPESKVYPGWVIHEKVPALTFKPLLPAVPALEGIYVKELTRHECEVTSFVAVFFFNDSSSRSQTFHLSGAGSLPFAVPEGVTRIELTKLLNGAGEGPFCLPGLSLYYTEESK
jgi:hypothetical protein